MVSSDEELMRALTRGERNALDALYERHAPRLHVIAFHLLHNDQAAEDAVQDAFLSLWLQADRYDPERGAVEQWLNGILRFACLDEYRRRGRTPQIVYEVYERAAAANVADQALSNVVADRLWAALATLPIEQQRVLELAWQRGYTHVQIAAHLRLPLGTVKGRLRLARRALRSYMGSLD